MQLYHHFTHSERICLFLLHSCGFTMRQVGRCLHRSASSISQELQRNKNKNGSYHPWAATIRS